MFYGLVKKSSIGESLHKYVALAPCSITTSGNPVPEDTLYKLLDWGIYALYNTPTWAEDIEKICSMMPNPYLMQYCDALKNDAKAGF